MSRVLVVFLAVGLFIGFTSCDSASSSVSSETTEDTDNFAGGTASVSTEDQAKANAMQEVAEAPEAPQRLVISTTSYAGIQPNDAISAHGDRLKATVMRNGEGTFDVYAIMDEGGQQIGYAQPNFEDKKLLGDIVITSPIAKTADGIRIGSTYGDLRKKYPGIEVHGSEIEGRVYANQGNLFYRLDTYNNKYNLDPNSIEDNVKVMEITLSGSGEE